MFIPDSKAILVECNDGLWAKSDTISIAADIVDFFPRILITDLHQTVTQAIREHYKSIGASDFAASVLEFVWGYVDDVAFGFRGAMQQAKGFIQLLNMLDPGQFS